jgi:hypothetical protein
VVTALPASTATATWPASTATRPASTATATAPASTATATRPDGYRVGGHPLGGPPLVGRGTGHGLARKELAKPVYHQGVSFTEWVREKIINFFTKLIQQVNSTVPGGWWALVVLGILAVIIIGIVLARLGPVSLAHRARGGALRGGAVVTAREHRDRAQRLAAAGDWSGAIRESLRAIAADLEERAILPPRAGRTADELAIEAGSVLPAYGDGLWSAARLFDDVCYGGRPGTARGYAQLRDLDAAVHEARPLPLAPASAAGGAV